MVHFKRAIIASLFTVFSLLSSCQSVYQTALVIAKDATTGGEATSILEGYGAPYQLLAVPQQGTALPTLATTNGGSTVGNFGLIIVLAQVSYNYGGTTGWASSLTTFQWNALYAYQVKYGVRMIQTNIS